MGYLETGMRVLDSASALLSRLQELAVLGANDTNTTADHEAINLEAEAIGDEFNRLMTTSTYKGRDVFNATAGSLYVSMGGRDQEMTFGIGRINYSTMYQGTAVAEAAAVRSAVADTVGTVTTAGPNQGASFNLAHLPSDAVVAKEYGKAIVTVTAGTTDVLKGDTTYVVKAVGNDTALKSTAGAKVVTATLHEIVGNVTGAWAGAIDASDVFKTKDANATYSVSNNTAGEHNYAEVNATSTAFKAGHEYEIVSMGSNNGTAVDAVDIIAASNASGTLVAGTKFTVDASVTTENLARLNTLTQGMTFRMSTDTLTKDIEAMQGLVNTARVQAGSQYAAIESAVNYTTDLTAQYELGYNTVNDVNFSMETAHLAKNQILQQAATAMLAQANQGQQGLLQLIS
jgi:flagellin